MLGDMKKIGLIGGMSWHSTALYYTHINRGIAKTLGNTRSADLALENLDFNRLWRLENDADWKRAAKLVGDAARRLEKANCTAILICSNAMYKVYDEVQARVQVPVIHIVDVLGEAMKKDGVKNAALLGTKNVMMEPWYRQRLVSHGITLAQPIAGQVDEIDRIIYEDLMDGEATRESQRTMKTFMTDIAKQDVEAVVLGCTELVLVTDPDANILPIYDSTRIHAKAAVDWMLSD